LSPSFRVRPLSDDRVICSVDTEAWPYLFINSQDEAKSALVRQLLREPAKAVTVSVQVVTVLPQGASAEESLREP